MTQSQMESRPDVADFLKECGDKIPGKLLYAKLWGSWSHNTQMPGSDSDFLAVYIAPTDEIMGIDRVKETATGDKPDFQAHEVGKFCNLLLKGNPGMVEMLFTERHQFVTPEWNDLRQMRSMFLNRKTLTQYIGYIDAQFKKLLRGSGLHSKGGKYGTKWAYHAVRIAFDAERIAGGHPPTVWKDGVEHETLMKIRQDEVSEDGVKQLLRQKMAAIRELESGPLLDEADKARLNCWLLQLRRTN